MFRIEVTISEQPDGNIKVDIDYMHNETTSEIERKVGDFTMNNVQEFLDHAFNPGPVRRCRICGCTDDHACPGGCYWVEDDLCSRCEQEKQRKQRAVEIVAVSAIPEMIL